MRWTSDTVGIGMDEISGVRSVRLCSCRHALVGLVLAGAVYDE